MAEGGGPRINTLGEQTMKIKTATVLIGTGACICAAGALQQVHIYQHKSHPRAGARSSCSAAAFQKDQAAPHVATGTSANANGGSIHKVHEDPCPVYPQCAH